MVAGAGRGPLVARALSAIARARRTVAVYAIEKNPNAFVTYVRWLFFLTHSLIRSLAHSLTHSLNP